MDTTETTQLLFYAALHRRKEKHLLDCLMKSLKLSFLEDQFLLQLKGVWSICFICKKNSTMFMQWRPGSRTLFSYVLYLYSILKSTRRNSKPLDNIFLDSLSLDFSFSDSSFAVFSSFSKDCDNWIWIFSCQKVKISHHINYFKEYLQENCSVLYYLQNNEATTKKKFIYSFWFHMCSMWPYNKIIYQ